jgi:hypothetical protein
MWSSRLREYVRARLTFGFLLLCLITTILAGAADTKWI